MVPTRGLDLEQALRFAGLALAGVDREYPNKPGQVLASPADVQSPRSMHPAFFGSFDWHSAVHGHWMLVRLLRRFPALNEAGLIRNRLNEHLTTDQLRAESDYFRKRENFGFERMYGWAWALRLAGELLSWPDGDGRRWSRAFEPLEAQMVRMTREFLPRLDYPIRCGTHTDTGFALGQILDYASVVGDSELAELIRTRALHYYSVDRHYPVTYEPSGEDFFSSGLNEADLMRRVLQPGEYSEWLDAFWPGLARGNLGPWGEPAPVSDLSDPRIVHLVGLNLSRAWTLKGIASALDEGDATSGRLLASAAAHQAAGLAGIFTGDYGGEHWLATFAVYLLTS